jgi:hypothetical protein
VKQGRRNFKGIVSTQERLSLWLAIIYCLGTTYRGLLMVMFMPLDALSYPYLNRNWPCNLERLHLDLAHNIRNA